MFQNRFKIIFNYPLVLVTHTVHIPSFIHIVMTNTIFPLLHSYRSATWIGKEHEDITVTNHKKEKPVSTVSVSLLTLSSLGLCSYVYLMVVVSVVQTLTKGTK